MRMRRPEMVDLREMERRHRMKKWCPGNRPLLRISPNTERRYRLAFEAAGLLAGEPDELPALEVLKAAVAAHVPMRSHRSRFRR